jgi:hypothetical protein
MYKIIQTYSNVGDLQKVNSHDNGVKRFNSINEAKEHLLMIKVNMTHWKNDCQCLWNQDKTSFAAIFSIKTSKGKTYQVIEYKIVKI